VPLGATTSAGGLANRCGLPSNFGSRKAQRDGSNAAEAAMRDVEVALLQKAFM